MDVCFIDRGLDLLDALSFFQLKINFGYEMRKLLMLFLTLFLAVNSVYSQCAMCKANITNSEEGAQLAAGINDGIVYLLVVPYLIFAGFALAIYVSTKRKNRQF